MPRITKTLIASSKPAEKRYFVWDDQPPGFGLAVQPTGAKSYVFQYRTPQGRTRRMTIGAVNAMTPDGARKRANVLSAKVKNEGQDPLAEKQAAREEMTIGEMFDAYLESEAFKEKSRTTQSTDKGRIENHLRPLLGKKFARKLSIEEVKKARREIIAGKTARDEKTGWRARSTVTGGEGTARQSIRLLSAIFTWAAKQELVAHNPAKGIASGGDGQRKTIMRGADDYKRLFETLDAMEAERAIRPAVADVFRLIALTGARREEIIGLEWREVDLEKSLITIPPTRHKSGRRTQTERVIGLPALACEILERQPKGEPGALVFPPAKEDADGRKYPASKKGAAARIDVGHPWAKVRKRAKLPEGIGLHGLRHSLATQMAVDGAGAAQIATALGHKRIETSTRYIHFAQDARAALAEGAAVLITSALKGAGSGKREEGRNDE